MNIYEINSYWIASENPNEAFGLYIEETDGLSHVHMEDLEEGESTNININVRRLTPKQIIAKNIVCCEDGCERCDEKNESVYLSLQQLMDEQTIFPVVLAKEE